MNLGYLQTVCERPNGLDRSATVPWFLHYQPYWRLQLLDLSQHDDYRYGLVSEMQVLDDKKTGNISGIVPGAH